MFTILNERQRIEIPATLFGHQFGTKIEPAVYDFAVTLSSQYDGGYWEMCRLDNGGFFMYPRADTPFLVRSPNGYEGSLSAQAFGIVACLFTYSQLSFSPELADVCGENFHRLREVALDHSEARGILRAID